MENDYSYSDLATSYFIVLGMPERAPTSRWAVMPVARNT
jgi:hypothetical protein